MVVRNSEKAPKINHNYPTPEIVISNYLSNFGNLITDFPNLKKSSRSLKEGGTIFFSTPPLSLLLSLFEYIIPKILNAKLISNNSFRVLALPKYENVSKAQDKN